MQTASQCQGCDQILIVGLAASSLLYGSSFRFVLTSKRPSRSRSPSLSLLPFSLLLNTRSICLGVNSIPT